MSQKNRIELNDFDDILNDNNKVSEENTFKEISDKNNSKTKKQKKNLIDEYSEEENESKDRRPLKQKMAIILPVTFGVLVLALVIAAISISVILNNGKIYAGVYFNDDSLYGMTKRETEEFIHNKYIKPFESKNITIKYEDKSITNNLAFYVNVPDAKDIANKAYTIARKGNSFSRLKQVMALKSKPVKLKYEISLNNAKLNEIINNLNENIFIEVKNPTYTVLPNSVTFTGGKNGLSINKENLENDILTTINALFNSENTESDITAEIVQINFKPLSETEIFNKVYVAPQDASYSKISRSELVITDSYPGKGLETVALNSLLQRINSGEDIIFEELPIVDIEPTITRANLLDTLIAYSLSSSSSINTNHDDVTDITRALERAINIGKSVDAINDLILLPGEEFNFWNELGDFGEDAGYVNAYDNSPGSDDKVMGGGLSQVASAIYLSAFTADLEILEHHNYKYIVNYGPLGCDAYVSANANNLIFKNTLEFPIRIVLTYENDTINAKILGTDTNSNKSVQVYVEPTLVQYKTNYTEDETLPYGTQRIDQSGIIGYEIKIYKKRIVGTTEILSEYVKTIKYDSRDEIILIGTKQEQGA